MYLSFSLFEGMSSAWMLLFSLSYEQFILLIFLVITCEQQTKFKVIDYDDYVSILVKDNSGNPELRPPG